MDPNGPHLPYEHQRSRRGSSSFANRVGRVTGLRGIAFADWLSAASLIVAAAIIGIALFYSH